MEKQSVNGSLTSPGRGSSAPFALLALVWLALVVYGSLTPFEFGPRAEGWMQWLASPRWDRQLQNDYSSLGHNNAINDLLVNLALYAPLGVFIRFAAWKRGWNWSRQCGAAVMLVALSSWVIECTQGLTVERVASLKDVCVNTFGGAAGALAAPQLRRLGVWAVFGGYRRLSMALHQLSQMIAWAREHPLALAAALVLDAALIWLACRAAAPVPNHDAAGVNWLPFAREFERSYDVAALQIGRTMAVYAAVSALLAVQFFSLSRRRGVALILFAAAAVGVAHQAARFVRTGVADTTEPVIALVTAGATVTAIMLLVGAVRAACRRRASAPVAVERRRVPYQYATERAGE